MDATISPLIVPAGPADVAEIVRLAGVIWRASYPGIISAEQIEYMLAQRYAPDLLRYELRHDFRFDRLLVDDESIGFMCYRLEQPDEAKLHRLYLLPAWQGRGLGSLMLTHCAQECRKLGARRLSLNVNKRNARAIRTYERHGFTTVESVVIDIGGGFVMDDYIMAKVL
jgi:diamine N-acetyltransferase